MSSRDTQICEANVGPDTPLRLERAAQIAFPGGAMTASGLRKERDRDRLVVEKIAGKEFTTLRQHRTHEGTMPRSAKGARLWLESEERDQDGKLVRRATWVIRDGKSKVRTGCARTDREGAEQALAEYIARKYHSPARPRSSSL